MYFIPNYALSIFIVYILDRKRQQIPPYASIFHLGIMKSLYLVLILVLVVFVTNIHGEKQVKYYTTLCKSIFFYRYAEVIDALENIYKVA